MPEKTPAEQLLLQPVNSWLERTVGLAAFVIGAVLLLGFVLYAPDVVRGETPRTLGAWVVLAILLLVGLFLASVGTRLVLQRPSKNGSLTAPWVWFCAAVTWAVLATTCLVITLKNPSAEGAQATAAAALFSLLSYGAGANFRRKTRRSKSAA
jgi:cytochrome bd-type quinol oxidase subunit 2